jgi:hypothetical protein
VNLWASDSYHASAFGYYLHALVDFGEITGQNPTVLGFDTVAQDLGFHAGQAAAMQASPPRRSPVQWSALCRSRPTWLMLVAGGGILGLLARRRRQVAQV